MKNYPQNTDKELEIKLSPFIGNIEARGGLVDKLDLRMLYNIVYTLIKRETTLEALNIDILINNTLIFNATDTVIREESINDGILKNVLSTKSFLGIKT